MDSPSYHAAIAISRFISWLFTSLPGIIVLALLALILLILRMAKAARTDRALRKASGEKLGAFAGVEAALTEAASISAKALFNIPSLLMSVAILALIATVSTSVARFDDFMVNQEKIRGYEKLVANLEKRYRLAKVECLSQEGGKLSLRLGYYDSDGEKIVSTQDLSLPGKEVFFDAIVLNFAYAGIESGSARNLAIPRCVFTDLIPEKEGIALQASDDTGLPYLFQREEGELYGLSKAEFDKRLGELMEMAKDEAQARKAGIVRSLYGSAVHRSLRTGQAYTVWIEQSGGLSIKEDSF